MVEYTTRSILAGVEPDPNILNGRASAAQTRAAIAALMADDIKVVELVKELFADSQQLLQEDKNAPLAAEILEKIIGKDILSKEALAGGGGWMTTTADDKGKISKIMLGGAYYKEWARGMVSYGVKSDVTPLEKWPDHVHLVRYTDSQLIVLKDENGDLITPGIKYVHFHLIPQYTVMGLVSGYMPEPLIDMLRDTTGINSADINFWIRWWQEHKDKEFKISDH